MVTLYNTDLTRYIPEVKINSAILEEIIPRQVKNNVEVIFKFKREIIDFTYLKSNAPSLIYLKVKVGEPLVEQPPEELTSENKTLENQTISENKTISPAIPKLIKKKKKPKEIKKPKKIEKKIVKIPEVKINEARDLYEKGLMKMAELQYTDAISIFNTILIKFSKNNPYYIKAQYRIVDCYYKTMDLKNPHSIMSVINMYFQLVAKYPKNKESAWAMYQMGNCYEKLGFFEEAMGCYKYVVKYYPKSIYVLPSLLEIGNINYKFKRYNEALNYYQTIMNKYPNRIVADTAFYKLGDCYCALGNYKKALDIYKKAMQKNPDLLDKLPETLYNVGNTYFHLKKYGKAREYFLKIRALYPKTVYVDIALLKIGETYVQQKNLKNALFVFNRVIQIKRNIEDEIIARIRMAEIGLNYKLPDELKKKYGYLVNPEKGFLYIIKHFPKNELAQIAYSKLVRYYLQNKDFENAVKYCEQFFKKYPLSEIRDVIRTKFKYALVGYINYLFYNENYFKILVYYEKYKDLYLNFNEITDINTYFKIAMSMKKFFLIDKSTNLFKKILSKAPKKMKPNIEFEIVENSFLNRNYNLTLQQIKNYEKKYPKSLFLNKLKFYKAEILEFRKNYYGAINIFQELKDKNYEPFLVTYKIAKDYQNMGYFEKANYLYQNLLNPGLNFSPSNFILSDIYFQKAYTEFLLKKYHKSINSFENFVEKFEDDKRVPEACYYISYCNFLLNNYKEAKKWINLLQKKFKGNFWEKNGEILMDRINWVENEEKLLNE